MKKIAAFILILCMVLAFSACGSQELTMKQLVEANKTSKLLETYDSISVYNEMDGEIYEEHYLTDAFSYEKHDTFSMYVTNDTGYAYNNDMYQKIVFLSKDGLIDYADYRAEAYEEEILGEGDLKQKIASVSETEEQITVTAAMNKRDLKRILNVDEALSLDMRYVLDAETYSMFTVEGNLVCDDGTTLNVSLECTYNEEMPEEVKTFMEYENSTGDFRTVSLVFHSGTSKEKIEHIQVPNGLPLGMAPAANATEGFSLYADAACTVPFASNGDYTSDVTIYIK